jgi:hypothetical protein
VTDYYLKFIGLEEITIKTLVNFSLPINCCVCKIKRQAMYIHIHVTSRCVLENIFAMEKQ